MISHLFPIDFSMFYLSISCPFLLSPENKSKKYWYVLLFFIFCIRKQKKISLLHSDRIRAKYKDVVIQCCASGGRANWGMLRGFDEFWVSDNTDALQRIYMQYG